MPIRFSTLFFDMNSFFASVAQTEEPDLAGRPVGILTTNAPNAACIASSIEAKRQGVRFGTRRDEARRMCSGIIFRVARHDVCVDYHHRIRAAVDTVVPIDAVHSVDEFSCRLMGREQALETALDIGRRLQATVLERVGGAMHCSVGLGPNKLLAKIAAELEKPGGLHWLSPETMPDRIAHLALDDLPGISGGMRLRLDRAGVRDIPALYALSPRHARAIWRGVQGERFLRELHGEAIVHPEPKRSMIGHGQVLLGPNRTAEGARLVARRLLVKAAARLRREGFLATRLCVGVRRPDHGRADAEAGFAATQDTFFLLGALDRHWPGFGGGNLMAVHVVLRGLVNEAMHSPDLFLRSDPGVEGPTRLCRAIDQLNRRFGQNTVRFGELPRHHVPYTGAKIAFGRIPEADDFFE